MTAPTRTRKAKRVHSGAWPAIRRAAFNRDRQADAPCWLCGQPIAYHLPNPHPLSYNGDLHPPLWAGGTEALANVRPSHRRCNCRRGAIEGNRRRGQSRVQVNDRRW